MCTQGFDAALASVGDGEGAAFAHTVLDQRHVSAAHLANEDFVAIEFVGDRSAAYLALHQVSGGWRSSQYALNAVTPRPTATARRAGLAGCASGQVGCWLALLAAIAIMTVPLPKIGRCFGRRPVATHKSSQPESRPSTAKMTTDGTSSAGSISAVVLGTTSTTNASRAVDGTRASTARVPQGSAAGRAIARASAGEHTA
jgi:hypothetical protein